jgi:PST family polysaccharide transporter
VTREIFSFGKFMVFQNILGAIEENVDYLIVGKRLGTTSLGLYTLGYRAPELAITSLPAVISNVVYPAYAKIQHDRDALRSSIHKTLQLVSWVAVPAGVGLAMTSSAFILTFYTAKWASAIPVMQLLSLYAMVYTLTYNFGDAYKAMGRPDILNLLSISTIIFTILILWFGAKFGIVGIAWAHLFRVILLGIAQVVIVHKMISMPLGQILEAILKPLLCAGIMAVVMWAASVLVGQVNPLFILIVEVLMGMIAYIISSWFVNRSVTLTVWTMGRHLITSGR